MKHHRKIIQSIAENRISELRWKYKVFNAETWEKISAESPDSVSAVCENIHDVLYWIINTLK